jgi:hypothetical protein
MHETTASEFLFLIVTLEQSRSFWSQISTCPSSTTGSSNGPITFYRELIDVTVLSSFHATLTKLSNTFPMCGSISFGFRPFDKVSERSLAETS